MYSNWNSNSYYSAPTYQESAKPDYVSFSNTFERHDYREERDQSDFTFLPQPTFYESVFTNPLDLSRHVTDVTLDTDGNTPASNKTCNSPYMPNTQPNIQKFNANNANYMMTTTVDNMTSTYVKYENESDLIQSVFTNTSNPSYTCKIEPTVPTSIIPINSTIKSIPDNRKFSTKTEDANSVGESESSNSDSLIKAQFNSLMSSHIWDEEKDGQLTKLGVQYKCDWKKIAKRFNHKKITPHFLKIRYKELTCAPLQRRMKFDHKEDLMIAKYFQIYGSSWTQMATHFKDRTPIMLKNRYYSFIRKRELMNILMQEVKEIEGNNQLVDDMMEFGNDKIKGVNDEPATPVADKKTKADRKDSKASNAKDNGRKISLENSFNFEMIVKAEDNDLTQNINENSQKIKLLEARVKSFQGLYLKAKKELDLLRSNVNSN